MKRDRIRERQIQQGEIMDSQEEDEMAQQIEEGGARRVLAKKKM